MSSKTELDNFLVILDKSMKESVNEKILKSISSEKKWKEKKIIHVSTIIKSFTDAVIEAKKYNIESPYLPPKFESVCNWLAFLFSKKTENQVLNDSISNIINTAKGGAMEHPEFRSWDIDSNVIFCNMARSLIEMVSFLEYERDSYIKEKSNGKRKSILPSV